MTFLTPLLAIAGIAGVSLPILIHLLFRRRRAPVEWAAMRFLLEAVRTRRRRLQMEQIILLVIRCLLIALLGMALARPIVEQGVTTGQAGPDTLVLLIDDGLVSGLEVSADEQGAGAAAATALERHIAEAVEIVRSLDQSQGVSIVTTARPARVVVDPPSRDHDAVIAQLRSMLPAPTPSDLGGGLRLAVDVASRSAGDIGRAEIVLLSEFRVGSALIEEPLPRLIDDATARRVQLVATPPATEPVTNVQVRSISPLRSVIVPGTVDGSGQVAVELRRTGGSLGAQVSTVRLLMEGAPVAEPRTIEWSPGQVDADVDFLLELELDTDREIGLSAVVDRDPLPIDDAAHAVVELRRRVRAALLERRGFGSTSALTELSAGQWIRRALEPSVEGPMQFVEVEPGAVRPIDLRLADVVIASRPDLLDDGGWEAAREFVDRGGLLLIAPPGELRVHQWTESLVSGLDLPIEAQLEAVDHLDGLALAEDQPRSGLLRLISSELGDLLAPVRVVRRLQLAPLATGGAELPLLFEDGTPLMIVTSPSPVDPDASPDGGPVDDAPEGLSADGRSAGLVVVLAVSPELSWTNLPSKPLMVPLFQELVRQGLSRIGAGRSLVLGDFDRPVLPPAAAELVGPDGSGHALSRFGEIEPALSAPGLHEVRDAGGRTVGALAVNVDAEAGRTAIQDREVVQSWLLGAGPVRWTDERDRPARTAETPIGSPIARWLLWTVLGLALLEAVLARRFSYATRGNRGAIGGVRPSVTGGTS